MRCNCENTACSHDPGACFNEAGKCKVIYLGALCDQCSMHYPPGYNAPKKLCQEYLDGEHEEEGAFVMVTDKNNQVVKVCYMCEEHIERYLEDGFNVRT